MPVLPKTPLLYWPAQGAFLLLFAFSLKLLDGSQAWPWGVWLVLGMLDWVLVAYWVGPPETVAEPQDSAAASDIDWEERTDSSRRLVLLADHIFTINQDLLGRGLGRLTEASQQNGDTVSAIAGALAELRQGSQTLSERLTEIAEQSSEARVAAGRVRQTIEQSNQRMRQISDTSGEIGKIVDTIGAIANQTNLLSLNAAIEAAKAGEQGRGFSVVAEEVRKLATRSNQAAGEIRNLIEASTEAVASGVESIEGLNQDLAPIFTQVDTLAEGMKLMNRELTEQDLAIQEIHHSGESLNQTLRQSLGYVAELEQAATAAGEGISLLDRITECMGGLLPPALLEQRYFAWKPEYSVGLNTIDEQHKVLIDLIDLMMAEESQEREPTPELETIMEAMSNYCRAHFAFEEAVMDRIDYPDRVNHKGIHDGFLDRVDQKIEALFRGQVSLREIIDLLEDWLIKHIKQEDPKYVPAFGEGGVN